MYFLAFRGEGGQGGGYFSLTSCQLGGIAAIVCISVDKLEVKKNLQMANKRTCTSNSLQ